ncbi:cytochrome P450 2L1-like [Macrobrachium nipponense]|uniref:cytochrome P450 2L1-like n=1 Tax=Macrobrachium nipponense TaxID=159736 RepID=UPI0030C80715
MLIELFLLATSLVLLWVALKRPPGLPPGRWGLPVIGYVPTSGKYIDDILKDFQKEFGDLYIWKFGSRIQVFIHDYHLVKQIFNGPDYIDRPDMEIFKLFEGTAYGISGSSGGIWHTNRRFILRQLRDLGMGKSRLVDAVQEQAEILVEALKEQEGQARPIAEALNFVIMNIIWKMTANKHFDIKSPKHRYLRQLIADSIPASNNVIVADMLPWTSTVLPKFVFRALFKVDKFIEIMDKFREFFQEMIVEHKESLNPDDPKDLIDAYLLEMKDREENPGVAEGVRHEADLRIVLFDALFAGTDTTYNTMKWIFLYLAAHPDKQRKLQEELDSAVPSGTLVTLEDKPRIPYTEAVINEVLRMSSLTNVGLPHCPDRDMVLAGYKIPKGSMVTPVTASIHFDPRYWDQPDLFLPERWLSPEGKFVMRKEGYLPFGTGKRSCVGESLARMELMIFTATVLQNFTISPPEGKTIDLLPDFDNRVIHMSRKQDVVFTSRNL